MSLILGDNFSYMASKPLDARLMYATIADMTAMADSTLYEGCLAYCVATDKTYQWKSTNTVDVALGKWREFETGGGADNIVEGYFNSADNLFYEESTYTTAITGEAEKIYIDLPNNKTYRFNSTIFVRLDEETFEDIQKDTLPAASANELGNIYQYTGATAGDLVNGYFYKCVSDEQPTPTYSWEQVNVQPGSSGGSTTKKTINVSIDLGGYSKNDVIATGTDYDTVIETLLNPTILPSYILPSSSLSYSLDNNGYYKVGATVAAKTATLTYNAGAIMLDGVKQNDRGGAATNYAVSTSGATTEYSSSSTTSGTFSVSALTRATKGTIVITGTVSYSQGVQPKDSKGADVDSPLPAGSCSATKTLNFIQPFYYGASNTSTISDFTGLTESVTPKANKTFSFTTSNQHMVMAYDSSYGNLKSILDPNSFETISGWTKSTVTVDGFSYYVYVANAKTTDTSAAFQFKF